MKTMKRVLIAMGIVVCFAASTLPLAAQSADISNSSTQTAHAFFLANDPADPTGCMTLSSQVIVISSDVRIQGRTVSNSTFAYVDAVEFDSCTGAYYTVFLDYPTVTEFSVSRFSAHLQAQSQVWDDSTQSVQSVTIEFTWSPTDSPARSTSTSHEQSPTDTTIERYAQMSRQAVASGSIVIGGTNFTPQPSSYADFATETHKVLQITR
jgi:hypothetical protein